MTTHALIVTAETTDAQIAEHAFECFALAHPREAYEHDAERFCAFVRQFGPDLTREEIESMLLP